MKNKTETLKHNKNINCNYDDKYFEFLNNIPSPILILDKYPNGNIIFCNKEWQIQTGYNLKESRSISLPGINSFVLNDGNFKSMLNISEKNIDKIAFTTRVIHKDKNYYYKEINMSYIDYLDCKRPMLLVKDISNNYKSLPNENTYFNTLYDELPIVFLIIDKNSGQIIDCNSAAYNYFKYGRSELCKLNIHDISSFVIDEECLLTLRENSKVTNISSFKLNSGDEKINEVIISNLKHANPNYILLCLRDITDQIKIERKLMDSESRYKTIVDNNYDGIYIYRDNRFIFANKTITKQTGYTEKEILNMDFWTIVYPKDVNRLKEFAYKRAKGLITESLYESRIICKNGKIKTCEFRVNSILINEQYAVLGIVRDITNKIKSEKKIKEHERFLSSLIKNLNGVVYRCINDKSFTMKYLTNTILKLSGYTQEELINNNSLPFIKLIHPDDHKIVNTIYDKESFYIEYRIICKDNTIKWVSDQGIKIQSNSKKKAEFEGILYDITKQKEIQQQLIESEEKFRYITENSIDIVWQVNKKMELSYISPSIENILGYSQSDITGKQIKNIIIHDELNKLKTEFFSQKVNASVRSFHKTEISIKNKTTNKRVILEVEGKIYYDQNNVLFGIHGIARNITERKKTDNLILETASLYKAIFGNTGTATCITNSRGTIILYNKRFIDLGDCTESELDNKKNIADFIPNILFHLKSEQTSFEAELLTSNNKKSKSVIVSIQKIENKNDYVVSLLDISKRKSAEKELLILNNDLENRVKKRTQQLLIANNSKSEFLANMSHEIRTPLNAIMGFAELLHKNITTPKETKYLESILVSGKNLLSLINDTLDLSKIEAGKLELIKAPTNIYSLLNEIEQIFILNVKSKGINLIFKTINNLSHEQYIFNMDANRVKQILINIVNNAIKYTSKGNIEILTIIETSNSAKNNVPCANISFDITDTGSGISKEFLSKIFDPFTQENSYKNHEFGGTGLGLSITQKLVHLMDGTINVESNIGIGSSFCVKLSDITISESNLSDKYIKQTELNNKQIKFENQNILIVDDKSLNIDYLSAIFENLNVQTIKAKNGEEAWNKLNSIKIDLIITDLKMPVLDGFELRKRILNSSKLKNIPIIAATAMASKSVIAKIEKHDFSSYILKPFNTVDIIQLITKYLPHKTIDIQHSTDCKDILSIAKEINAETLKEITKELLPLLKKIEHHQSRNDVLEFSKNLKRLGKSNHHHNFLYELGKNIELSMMNFDLYEVLKNIDYLKSILNIEPSYNK